MHSQAKLLQGDIYSPLFGGWTKVAQYSNGRLSAFETIYCIIVNNMGVVGVRSEEDVGKLDTVSQLLLHPPNLPLHDISHLSTEGQRGDEAYG